MNININKEGKAQCPSCKKWVDLELDHDGSPWHEIECCGRRFLIPLDFENLERFKNGKKIEQPPDNWWVRRKY